DAGVADGVELQVVGVTLGDDPDHGLAAVQAVGLGLPFLGEGRQLAAEVDQVLVTLGPVTEQGEFVGDGGLGLGGAGFGRTHQARLQRTPCGVSSSRMPSAASWLRMASARAKSRAALAALRSSTRAWMRASSSLPPP